MRQIVDIFGRAGEMDELAYGTYLRVAIKAFLQPVFKRFDIMVGTAFDGFDLCSLSIAECGYDFIQFIYGRFAERGDLLQRRLCRQGFEPLHLHHCSMTYQGILTKVWA